MGQQYSPTLLSGRVLAFAICLLVLLAGCGKSTEQKPLDTREKLVGTWKEKFTNPANPTLSIFLDDGTFQHKTGADTDGSAKWQLLPDGRLKLMEIAGAQKPTLIFNMVFAGDKELILTEEGEKESLQTLIKVK